MHVYLNTTVEAFTHSKLPWSASRNTIANFVLLKFSPNSGLLLVMSPCFFHGKIRKQISIQSASMRTYSLLRLREHEPCYLPMFSFRQLHQPKCAQRTNRWSIRVARLFSLQFISSELSYRLKSCVGTRNQIVKYPNGPMKYLLIF